jgi:hypothetical protein
MILVLKFTSIDFTWHTLIGCLVTLLVGNFSAMMKRNTARQSG